MRCKYFLKQFYGSKIQFFLFSLKELVIEGKNGYIFSNQQELSNLLQELFEGYPLNESKNKNLQNMKDELKSFGNWDEIWNRNCKPIFNEI